MRIRIQLSGLQTRSGRAPHLSVWDVELKRSIFDEDIVTPEDKPIIIEFVTTAKYFDLMNEVTGKFPLGHTRNVSWLGQTFFINTKDTRFIEPTGYKLVDDEGVATHPLLLVDWVEWETASPLESDVKKREGLVPVKEGDLAATCDQRRSRSLCEAHRTGTRRG